MSWTAVQRVSHHPAVRAAIRALRIQRAIGDLYFRAYRPADGVVELRAGRARGRFDVKDAGQLRALEAWNAPGDESAVEWDLRRLLDLTRPDDVVFDVGANMGLYAIPLAAAVGERGLVACFEPERSTFAQLRRNVALSGCRNVRLFPVALGAEAGKARLRLPEHATGASLVPSRPEGGGYDVEVAPGDTQREREALPLPAVVKIDVEGFERQVLRGLEHTLRSERCRVLCCEVHNPAEAADILVTMRRLGFVHVEQRRRGRELEVIARKA